MYPFKFTVLKKLKCKTPSYALKMALLDTDITNFDWVHSSKTLNASKRKCAHNVIIVLK